MVPTFHLSLPCGPRVKNRSSGFLTSPLTCWAISPTHNYRLGSTLESGDTDIQTKSDWLKFLCSLWEHPFKNQDIKHKNRPIQRSDWLRWGSPSSAPQVCPSQSPVLGRGGRLFPETRSTILQLRECSWETSCVSSMLQALQGIQKHWFLFLRTEAIQSIFSHYRGTKWEPWIYEN